MANTLRFKRGLASGLPTGAAGEPLFTTDTFDLYIGNGSGNTRFQKYIASGSTTQILRGDGSLYTFPLAISSPSNGQVLKYNGTSWVNDSDSGITGSGAAGQVAYFTGATTQGGSNNLFWDSANNRLGIGTTTPSDLLQVSGNIASPIRIRVDNASASGSGALIFSQSANPKGYIEFNNSTNNFDVWQFTNNALRFGTNNTERMLISGSGFVGIGTSSPNDQLEIAGNTASAFRTRINNANASGTETLIFTQGTTLKSWVEFSNSTNNFDIWQFTNNALRFGTNNTERARIFANGNFGIGTGASDNGLKFQVNGTGYFSGSVGIGTTSLTGYNLNVSKNITGAVNGYNITSQGTVQSDVTSTANYFISSATVQNTAFTLPQLYHFRASGASSFGSATVTNQYGFAVNSVLVGATNNYGFYGDIASGTGRWNLYMNGTANNYMAGSLGIGGTGLTEVNLRLSKSITGAANAYAVYQNGQVLSAVTSSGYGFYNTFTTEPTAFTLSNYVHYETYQTTLGAGSTVTNQFGFRASATLTSATNNYGFRGDLAASGTSRWNLYMNGSAPNYLNGELLIGSTSNSGEKLQVNGTMKVTGNLAVDTNTLFVDAVNNRVGIKTTTPGATFVVNGNTDTVYNDGDLKVVGNIALNSSNNLNPALNRWAIRVRAGGVEGNLDIYDARFALARATFDASGNLGLGTTPSAWASSFKALQVGATASLGGFSPTGEGAYLSSNAFYNGTSWIYQTTASSAQYVQISGQHRWFQSSSGTAGNAITFTESMRIATTGNLLIGSTSDSGERLQVTGTAKITGATAINDNLTVSKTQNSTTSIIVSNPDTTTATYSTQAQFRVDVAGNQIGALKATARNLGGLSRSALYLTTIGSYDLAFGVNSSGTPSMVLDINQNFGIGLTAPTERLHVSGNAIVTGNLTVDTNTLFVDASANEVGIGTTSPNSTLHIEGSVSKQIVAKTANYTATASDHTILCDTTSGGFTITLPTATTCEGRIYVIKKVIGNSGVSNVTIDGNGSETIDGGATLTLQCKSSVMIQSDGANWYILSLYNDTSCL